MNVYRRRSRPRDCRSLWVVALVVLLVGCETPVSAPDPRNATFLIENRAITLADGRAEQPAAPGSAARVTVQLIDKQASGDIDNDRKPDTAVVLAYSGGGSGTFEMLSVLLNDGSERGTVNAQLLGDRIIVKDVSIGRGVITVDYLDRRSGEPFTTAPSVNTTKKFVLTGRQLVEQP